MTEQLGRLGPEDLRTITKEFTPEVSSALIETGYHIYPLGQSIEDLIRSGRKFWSSGPDEKKPDLEQFKALISMSSEVAINPNRLFLKDSNKWVYGEGRRRNDC